MSVPMVDALQNLKQNFTLVLFNNSTVLYILADS